MFARLVLDSEATKLFNIWPRGSSIPIFLWGGSCFVTKDLSMSRGQAKNHLDISQRKFGIFCGKFEADKVYKLEEIVPVQFDYFGSNKTWFC